MNLIEMTRGMGRCCIVGDLWHARKFALHESERYVKYCPEAYSHPVTQIQYQPREDEIMLTHSPIIVDKYEPHEVIVYGNPRARLLNDKGPRSARLLSELGDIDLAKWGRLLTTAEIWALTWGEKP